MKIQDQLRDTGQDVRYAECLDAADYIDRLEAVAEAARTYFDVLDDFRRRNPGALGGPGQGTVRRALQRLSMTPAHMDPYWRTQKT